MRLKLVTNGSAADGSSGAARRQNRVAYERNMLRLNFFCAFLSNGNSNLHGPTRRADPALNIADVTASQLAAYCNVLLLVQCSNDLISMLRKDV